MLSLNGQFISGGGASDGCAGSMATVIQGSFASSLPDTAKSANTLNVNSPTTFYALPGVGPSGSVTLGTFAFLRLGSRFEVKITQYGTVSGDPDIVSTFPVTGVAILNYPNENAIKSIELKGAGAVEYIVAGMK